jgi:hypothetical protein
MLKLPPASASRVLRDPPADVLIARSACDDRSKLLCIDAACFEEPLIKRTIELIVPVRAGEGGPTFIQRAGGELKAAKLFMRGSRFLGTEVFGEATDGIQVFLRHAHKIGRRSPSACQETACV